MGLDLETDQSGSTSAALRRLAICAASLGSMVICIYIYIYIFFEARHWPVTARIVCSSVCYESACRL